MWLVICLCNMHINEVCTIKSSVVFMWLVVFVWPLDFVTCILIKNTLTFNVVFKTYILMWHELYVTFFVAFSFWDKKLKWHVVFMTSRFHDMCSVFYHNCKFNYIYEVCSFISRCSRSHISTVIFLFLLNEVLCNIHM